MQLTYTLTEQDHIDYSFYTYKTSPTMQKSLMRQRLRGPILFMLGTIVFPRVTDVPRLIWAAFFLVAGLAWYFYYPKKMEKHLMKIVRKRLQEGENRGLLSETYLTLTEEGITLKSEFSQSNFNWDMFVKVEESEKHIYIFNSSVSALIIPKMAFSSSAVMEEFLSSVNNRIHQ